ncbi:unnamed protein product [Mytilus coruscus]|uniref:ZMYM2-like/QRICH1 C-terminal domain-containing protein n=1 Tax=Mytilus coruscus TaxID=42192 RepID=A0A6J8D7L7_MYTCO|nr:unnamed protein product [Mytilus coruscus]
MDPGDDPYQLLFQENMDEYTSDDDYEIANFYLQTSPSINYYTFKQTSPQNNEQKPHPSQITNPVPTANISDIDFLDDDFELEGLSYGQEKHLKELGLGNLPNAAEAIESDEKEELFSSGAFRTGNPHSLLAAIWYLNTIHFGLRGSHEHRQLKWGDITLGTEPNGTKKLTNNERLTKTRDGTNSKNTRAYAPKSWNENHITMYLGYKYHRPPDMCSPESPFYLGVNRSVKAKYWYKCQPLGEKKLQNLMKNSVKKSNVGTSKKLTNHSGRKTAITRLLDEGMPVTAVQQHTGYKSIESINNYAKNSIKTPNKMCEILDKSKLTDLESKSKVTKSEKAVTAPNPESNPESYIYVKKERKRNQYKVGNQAHLLRFESLATDQGCGAINGVAPSTAPSTQVLKNSSVQVSPAPPKLEFSYSTTDFTPKTTTESVWLPRLTEKEFKLYSKESYDKKSYVAPQKRKCATTVKLLRPHKLSDDYLDEYLEEKSTENRTVDRDLNILMINNLIICHLNKKSKV